MKVKTQDLTGPALDWAVALSSGATAIQSDDIRWFFTLHGSTYVLSSGWGDMSYHPSTNWAQGGPIIEMQEITVKHVIPATRDSIWQAFPSRSAKGASGKWGIGPTPLVASMRCYVASKLGEEVEIPEELK